MLKKTVTYKDFLGTERTEDLYFNLTKTELTDMQMSVDGGLGARLEKMIKAVDNKEIYKSFVKIVLAAYGELSDDGKYHVKVDENGHKLCNKFRQSLAYEALMDEITKDETSIAEFCKGILPADLNKEGKKPNGEFHPVK
jgi:hypothetical protein